MSLPYDFRSTGFQTLTGTFHRRDKITANASASTGGTWTYTISGQTATELAHNIDAATMLSALVALSNVASGDVTVTMLSGANMGVNGAVMEIVWNGSAFANSNPTTSANFASLTGGGGPHVLSTVVRQTISIASGPGLAVKGARLSLANVTTLDSLTTGTEVSHGITDGTDQRCIGFRGEDGGIATNANASRIADNAAVLNLPGGFGRCKIVSQGTDAIDVDWVTIPAAGLRGRATFLEGSGMSCKVTSFAGSSSNNTAQASPSLGFESDGGFILSAGLAFGDNASGTDGIMSFGAFGRLPSITQWACAICAEDAQSATSSGAHIENDRVAIQISSAAGTVTEDVEHELTAINSDKIEVTTRTAGVSLEIAVLAFSIGGKKVFCAVPTPTTSSTGSKSITAPGFPPRYVLAVGMRIGSVGTLNTGAGSGAMGVGDYTVDGNGSVACLVRDGQTSAADAAQDVSNTYFLLDIFTGTARETRGNATAFTSSGFDFTIETASAADRATPYMAVEHPTITGTFGLRVAAPAIDSAGTERISGTFGLRVAAPAIDFVAAERFTGTIDLAAAAPALDFAGMVAAMTTTGTFELAVEAPQLTFAGALRISGTFGLRVAAPALDLTGAERFAGVFDLAVTAPALDFVAQERIAGAFALRAAAPALDFAAQLRISGAFDLAAAAPALTLVGTSLTETAGDIELAVEAPALTFAGNVQLVVTGAFGLRVHAPALDVAAQERFTGTIALRAPAPALDVAAAERFAGVFDLAVRAPELTLAGAETIAGAFELAARAPELDLDGVIATNVDGTFGLRVAAPVLSAIGSVPHDADRIELEGSYVGRVALPGSHVARVALAGSFGG